MKDELRPFTEADASKVLELSKDNAARPAVAVIQTESTRDWTEDFTHENGQYLNECVHCGHTFTGHKRRVSCRSCSSFVPKLADWQR